MIIFQLTFDGETQLKSLLATFPFELVTRVSESILFVSGVYTKLSFTSLLQKIIRLLGQSKNK